MRNLRLAGPVRGRRLSDIIKQIRGWTKPARGSLMTGTLTDLTRSRADLVIENAILWQQLIVLNQQVM
jgi:hypothetical protein